MIAILPALAAALLLQEPPADSARPLTFDDFHRVVADHHPVARQARLLEEIADGDVRVASGSFDPLLTAGWDRKSFRGTQYYDYLDAEVKIPTPWGLDLKVGYERTDGQYFAADRRTPAAGLVTAGVSIPLGQRLVTDERRTALAQARAMREFARGDRVAAVNRLLLDAARLYGAWYGAFRRLELGREGVELADFRLRSVRSRAVNGDAAPIDTLEALLEVQRRRVQLLESEVEFRNASLRIEGALWDARGAPMALAQGAVPSREGLEPTTVDDTQVSRWLALAERRHPELRKVQARVRQAEAERALTAQRVFVPDATLSYSAIGERSSGATGLGDALGAADDAKFGGSLRVPLLFRRERGSFSASSGRLDRQRFELAIVRRDIGIAVTTAANDLRALDSLLAVQRTTVEQSRLLLQGEQRKFDNGESTLFLVNARERLVIDEELRLIALEARYAVARAALAVALGEPGRLPAE